MMSKASESFLNALRAAPDTVDEARRRQHEAWLTDLADLRRRVRGWLAPVADAESARLTDVEIEITDQDVGTYSAPALHIDLVVGGMVRRVALRPRGMRVVGVVESGGARFVGAAGRVDLEQGAIREILLRVRDDGETRWLTFGTGTKRELDEALFFELLARISDVDLPR
jgi:hypothetical protein